MNARGKAIELLATLLPFDGTGEFDPSKETAEELVDLIIQAVLEEVRKKT